MIKSGKKIDSNVDTAFHHVEPYTFQAGVGRMIKGFDEAMMFMNKKEKINHRTIELYRGVVFSEYAYDLIKYV